MTDAPTSKSETAYIALKSKLQETVGLAYRDGDPYVSRRLTDAANLQPEDMPVIFINETGEEIETTKGLEGVIAAKQTLTADLYLYCSQGIQEGVCSTQINNLIQAIRVALSPDSPSMTQDLGNTVSHCWISGKIEIIEGVLNGQGIAIIPVNILTNN